MITSTRNDKVAAALRLRKRAFRQEDRAFLVEGAQAVGEALAASALTRLYHGDPTHPLVGRARADGVETIHVGDAVIERLTSTVTPQPLVGVASYLDVPLDQLSSELGCAAVLHAVRDPGNAGTVLRSADASGADAVVVSSSSVDVYNEKTVRATAGSLFHLPVVRDVETPEALEALRARGMTVLAMDAHGEADLFETDLTGSIAFVFGNEAWGLPEEVRSLADRTVRVPIGGGAESLNLAAAASVCLFERARQRRQGRRAVLETIITAAAHDIRSPLTAMKGFGHALARRWEQMTDEQRSLMLEGIVYDTDRLNAIVRQLVDAARITAGSLELFPESTDVGELVGKIADSLARDPDHPGLEWTGGEVVALVDPERLRLILEAFVESLVWWTSEGPVRLDGEVRDGRLVVEASRAGTTLDAAGAEALFAPREPGSGSGSKIGMFVARGVAEAQGGSAGASVDDGVLRLRAEIAVATP